MTLEKLEKGKKSNWGGRRKNSGRRPLLNKEDVEKVRQLIAQHGAEIDESQKQERLLAMLEVLYQLGLTGNIAAIKEYFDRQLGKSKESIDLTTKGRSLNDIKELTNEQLEQIIIRSTSGKSEEGIS